MLSNTGRYVSLPRGGRGFIPNPLPPDPPLEVDHEMWSLLSETDRAVGRLDGATEIVPDPALFVKMYVSKEAVLSSQIEGTQASLADLLEYEVKRPKLDSRSDVGEVVNYVEAMNHGLAQLKRGPVALSLIKELHAKLLAGTRGSEATPGEFRRRQNWIGEPDCLISEATFVPPPPEEIEPAMQALEVFMHRPGPLPPLIKTGLVHAQFESIHPFTDGNGRVGRLLIALMLCSDGILRRPLLYPSLYFKKHRREYYDLLQVTRSPGKWEMWLKFFIRGIASSADQAARTAKQIVRLREEHRALIQARLGRRTVAALALLEWLYAHPVVNVRIVTRVTGQTYANANKLVADFEKMGLLAEESGQKRNRRFSYKPYTSIFDEGERVGQERTQPTEQQPGGSAPDY